VQDGFCPDEPGNIGMTAAEVVAITGCASDQPLRSMGLGKGEGIFRT